MIWGAKEAPSERVLTSMGHEFESFIRLLKCQAAVWKEPKLGPLYLNHAKPEVLQNMQIRKNRQHRYNTTD